LDIFLIDNIKMDNGINKIIGNYFRKDIKTNKHECKFCGKKAIFTSTTMKAHIAGGEFA
jgi:hypothetical protein